MSKHVSFKVPITILTIGVLLSCLAVVKTWPQSIQDARPRPRFEAVYWESAQNKNMIAAFEVWHDKESGQEFICARSYYNGLGNAQVPISCWQTGRKW